MDQLLFAGLIVAVLVALAGYYAWQQVQSLRRLHEMSGIPEDDRRYSTRLAYRRLINSGFMLVLAALLACALSMHERATQISKSFDEARERGEEHQLAAEDRDFVRWYGAAWIAVLVVLLIVLMLAAFDLLATRRFGMRMYRQLQADRRAMIQEEISKRRYQRNGHAE